MGMKSESREEALERMKAISAAEKEGSDAVSEGQLQPDRGTPPAEGSVEARELERHQEARVAKPTNDYVDEGQNTVSDEDAGLGAAPEAQTETRVPRRRSSSTSDNG